MTAESPEKPNTRPGPLAHSRWSTGVAVAALVCITLTFYYGLWLPDLAMIKRDSYMFYPPLKQYLVERLSAGELPHWFPYESLGRPFIGAAHTGVFHPFTALYFLLPVHDAYRDRIDAALSAGVARRTARRQRVQHRPLLRAAACDRGHEPMDRASRPTVVR